MQRVRFPVNCAPRSIRGFTVIELLITLAVLGILSAVALPSLGRFISSNRLSGQTNEMIGDLSYARSEAATRGVIVTVCPSTDQASCVTSSPNWANGRIVFVDSDASGVRDTASGTTETLLRARQAFSGSSTLAMSGFGTTNFISFRPYGGLSPATAGSFKICPSSGTSGKLISVAATGRPKPSTATCP